jgi:hypothetical protein
MDNISVNKESLKAVLEYMYLDEWDLFLAMFSKEDLSNLDTFFEKKPEYKTSIMYHLHVLAKPVING